MPKTASFKDYRVNSDFCERQLKRLHLTFLERADDRGLDKCGVDCTEFEYFRDDDPQQVGIIRFADAKDMHVPQYLRDYVDRNYTKLSSCEMSGLDDIEQRGIENCDAGVIEPS